MNIIYILLHILFYAYIHMSIHTHVHTYLYIYNKSMHIHVNIHSFIHIYLSKHINTYTYQCTYISINKHFNTYKYINISIYIHFNTYICKYLQHTQDPASTIRIIPQNNAKLFYLKSKKRKWYKWMYCGLKILKTNYTCALRKNQWFVIGCDF